MSDPVANACPVCEARLSFEPWTGESASDEICPSCGIQFGYNDARRELRAAVYEEWRRAWLANDRKPFHGEAWRRVSAEVAAAATGQREIAMSPLFRFPTAVQRDPAIEAWMRAHPGDLGAIARRWFDVMRACGDDVRELLHDGHPTACVGDAAFAYVNAFRAHVNVGFFRGAEISDPAHLLEGTGRFMRHVKLGPDRNVSDRDLAKLIETAYADMKRRLKSE